MEKKTRGFPNRGERYGAKYENAVAYLLSGWSKTGRANFDILLDITFLLLELFLKFKLICKVETNI